MSDICPVVIDNPSIDSFICSCIKPYCRSCIRLIQRGLNCDYWPNTINSKSHIFRIIQISRRIITIKIHAMQPLSHRRIRSIPIISSKILHRNISSAIQRINTTAHRSFIYRRNIEGYRSCSICLIQRRINSNIWIY